MMTKTWIDFWLHIDFESAYGKHLFIDCVNDYGKTYGLNLPHGSYNPSSLPMQLTLLPNLKRKLIKVYERITGVNIYLAGSNGVIESLDDSKSVRKKHNRALEIVNGWGVEQSLKILVARNLLNMNS